MGNGAKAAQKRERNAGAGAKGGKSQLKSNEASKNIICQTCRQPFMSTTRAPASSGGSRKKQARKSSG